MKFVFCSDLHGEMPALPEGDFLVLAGDLGPNLYSRNEEIYWFNLGFFPWLKELPHKNKVIIAGNHDFVFEKNFAQLEIPEGTTYLLDNSKVIDGLNFYGSPRTPQFGNWAYMSEDNVLGHYWEQIPLNTQILVTHGPPHGIRDQAPRSNWNNWNGCSRTITFENVGSKTLREKLKELKELRICVFGHIHEGYGISEENGVFYVNSSYWDGNMRNKNKPIILEIEVSSDNRYSKHSIE